MRRKREFSIKRFVKLEIIHEPVMVIEVIKSLGIKPFVHLNNQARKYIDATLGGGGLSLEIVCRGGNVLGIDDDESMLEVANERLKEVPLRSSKKSYGGSVTCPPRLSRKAGSFKLVHGNFKNIYKIALNEGFLEVDGVIFDLGISNLHYEDEDRGFSYKNPNAPLDMRLNPKLQGVTASDLLNILRHDQLTNLFSVVLGKFESRKLATKIIIRRKEKSIKTVGDFLSILGSGIGYKKKLHTATLPFLALRMAVGSELDNLRKALPASFRLLKGSGKLVVISFHSAEDRIVKSFYKDMIRAGKATPLTKKPIVANKKEILINPKSRSAKLRVLKKI
jgi:16S rRNA (cytosine1402-N4)-methyltransferase